MYGRFQINYVRTYIHTYLCMSATDPMWSSLLNATLQFPNHRGHCHKIIKPQIVSLRWKSIAHLRYKVGSVIEMFQLPSGLLHIGEVNQNLENYGFVVIEIRHIICLKKCCLQIY